MNEDIYANDPGQYLAYIAGVFKSASDAPEKINGKEVILVRAKYLRAVSDGILKLLQHNHIIPRERLIDCKEVVDEESDVQ